MNKQLLIGVAAVVLIGGGVFLYQNQKAGGGSVMDTLRGGSDLGTISGNLKDLAARGVPMQCTFSNTQGEDQSSGTVYISGNNMRGDFMTVDAEGKEMQTYMIKDGDTTYTWSSDEDKGIKMTLTEEDAAQMEADVDALRTESPEELSIDDQNMDYNCKPWIPNPASFTPPTDVEFTDLSAQLEQMQKANDSIKLPEGATMKEAQCAACMQAPEGDARDQCKKALGCE